MKKKVINSLKSNIYNKTVLSNGITLVTEQIPYLRSVSIGIWVKTGPVNERKENNGISHFIEHLVFKGTANRSASQLAAEIDSIGGQIDAYTSREYTAYSIRILDDHLPIAFDIFSDMLLHSEFKKTEILREKDVILEEIKMIDDTPSDFLYDIFCKDLWPNHPLGMPIQGTKESLMAMARAEIINYLEQYYSPQNIIITVAGNLDHSSIYTLSEKYFATLNRRENRFIHSPAIYDHKITFSERDLEQIHFYIGIEGIKSTDTDRYKAYLLNIILGGGMSSRLFQKIREEKGLAYSIYSFNNMYEYGGLFGVYAATGKTNLPLAIQLTIDEIKNICSKPVDKNDLIKAKEQLKGNILLSLESSISRMSQLARQEFYFRRHITLDEISRDIEKVTVEDIQMFAGNLFSGKIFSFAGLGDISKEKVSMEMLTI